MKKHILFCICNFLLAAQGVFAAQLTSKIDERVEFAALVCKYTDIDNRSLDNYYHNYIDRVFLEKTQWHPLFDNVFYFKQKYPLDREMLLSAALTWELSDGHIVQDNNLTNRMMQIFSAQDYKDFMSVLDSYYRQVEFHNFFASQQPLYAQAKKEYDEQVLSLLKSDFFRSVSDIDFDNISVYITLMGNRECVSLAAEKAVVHNIFRFAKIVEDEKTLPSLMGFSGDIVIYPLLCAVSEIAIGNIDSYMPAETSHLAMEYYKSALYLFTKANIQVEKVLAKQIAQLIALQYLETYHPNVMHSYMKTDMKRGFIWENELFTGMKKIQHPADRDYLKQMIPDILYELKSLTM